jgi:multiple sugar transport system substrate-binding protein
VAGQSSPQAALNEIAGKWNQINNQKGHAKQLAAYRASLNLGATG